MGEVSSLPDDMLRDILARCRGDAAALLRYAMVCKRWRRLVADPSFLRRCWPPPEPEKKGEDEARSSSSPFAGFFAMVRLHRRRGAKEPCFIPAPGSPLGAGRRALESLVPGASAGLFRNSVPVACRHGLLLVRLAVTHGGRGGLRLAVCDLLTGACHVLPPLNPARELEVLTLDGYAILTGADCRSPPSTSTAFFKVVVVAFVAGGWADPHKVGLHTFSSPASGGGVAGWSASRVESFDCYGGDGGILGPICHGDAVVLRGTAHWLFADRYGSCYHTIELDAETGRLSSTKLPPFPESGHVAPPCLGVAADGALSLLTMRIRPGSCPLLQIWTRQTGDEAAPQRWLCGKTVELRVAEGEEEYYTGAVNTYYMMGEKCGKVLVTAARNHVYAGDLGTGKMEKVVEWLGGRLFNRDVAVPLEMDWPALLALSWSIV